MQVLQKYLMDMLMRELKEELEARDQPKTGNKAWLRRRGCTARTDLVRAHGWHDLAELAIDSIAAGHRERTAVTFTLLSYTVL